MSQTIAIIGAGPAGCALACLLAQRGVECLVFDDARKPSLLVGESLVPAAIPILRRLGIEPEVAAISSLKKGAALRHGSGEPRVDFAFQKLGNGVPEHAYNIPRPEFDALLRKRAETLGARFVVHRAAVSPTATDSDRDIQLDGESLAAAGLTRSNQPDLLIDASGRTRLFSRTLKIPADRGTRSDIAHFAHFENYSSDSVLDGQIVISVLECGWSWQIPLPGKTSVGVVLNNEAAATYGTTAAQRLEAIMRQNNVLNKKNYRRVTEVKTYSNYQLIAQRGYGNGWMLLGDALGFVDPMLSPGVFMALESASLMDELVFKTEHLSDRRLAQARKKYYREVQRWHRSWSRTIEYFYDGRLLSLGEMRPDIAENESRLSPRRLVDGLITKILSRLVSGSGTRSKFNQAALAKICQLLTTDQEMLANYAIKNSIQTDLDRYTDTNVAETPASAPGVTA